MNDKITEDDIKQARSELKQEYRERTGHELPEHVIDNLEYLGGAGIPDRAEIQKLMDEAREAEEPEPKEILAFLGWSGVTLLGAVLLTGYLSGVGAQVVGGIGIWLTLFAGVPLAWDWLRDWRESDEGAGLST